jgi:hypothetical protein
LLWCRNSSHISSSGGLTFTEIRESNDSKKKRIPPLNKNGRVKSKQLEKFRRARNRAYREMMESSQAAFFVSPSDVVNLVRTRISLKFSLPGREISHQVHQGHKVHKIAGVCDS